MSLLPAVGSREGHWCEKKVHISCSRNYDRTISSAPKIWQRSRCAHNRAQNRCRCNTEASPPYGSFSVDNLTLALLLIRSRRRTSHRMQGSGQAHGSDVQEGANQWEASHNERPLLGEPMKPCQRSREIVKGQTRERERGNRYRSIDTDWRRQETIECATRRKKCGFVGASVRAREQLKRVREQYCEVATGDEK